MNTTRFTFTFGIVMVLAAAMTQSLSAQTSYAEVESEGWQFSPVLKNQAVESLFAWLDDSLARDANIRAIYFTRDKNGQWEARAWEDVTPEEAMAYVHAIIDQTAEFSPSDISNQPIGPCSISPGKITPVVLVNGLFPNDRPRGGSFDFFYDGC